MSSDHSTNETPGDTGGSTPSAPPQKVQEVLDGELMEEARWGPVKSQFVRKKHGRPGRPSHYDQRKIDSQNARKQHFLMCINMAGLKKQDVQRLVGSVAMDQIDAWLARGKKHLPDKNVQMALAKVLGLEPAEVFAPEGAKY